MLIEYKSVKLGTVSADDEDLEDWADKDGAAGHFARSALYSILQEHPKPPNEDRMAPQAWILTVLRVVCSTIVGKRSQKFERQVFTRYARHYGLSQMGNITGHKVPMSLDMAAMFGGRPRD